MGTAKATINIVIDEAFKGTSVTDIEYLVEESNVEKDERISLENTAMSLTEKIKQAKVVSDVDIADNAKEFKVQKQQNHPLGSLVNVLRCSRITKEDVLILLNTDHDEAMNTIKCRTIPETTPETKNYMVSNKL